MLLIMRHRQKLQQETGRWIFMWYLWARWTTTRQQIFLFFSPPKRQRHKSLRVLLHLTLWKAYVLPFCLYSAQKMDSPRGHRKRPCPLVCVTMSSNKITCQGSSLFVRFPPPLTPRLFVTSNMLLWCFRHIFLMFYTPYNLLCVARPILLADIIDGACSLARVNLAEKPQCLSPRW